MGREKIVFLGGVPGVGKTSIAGAIAKKFDIDIMLSGDYLREFMRPITNADSGKLLDVSVYETWKRFGAKTGENIIKGFEKQSESICSGISATIERAAKNGENLIIESLYLNQALIDTLKKHGACAAYLYISDFDTHAKRLNEREQYTHFSSPGGRLVTQLDVYKEIMNYSVNLSKNNNIKVFDNLDFKKTEEDVLKMVGAFYAAK